MKEEKLYKVLGIRDLTADTFVLKLERGSIEFVPGQCINIGVPGESVNREYSTYSGLNDNYLEFLIREVKDGVVSPKLRRLKKGDKVEIEGAYGLFTIKEGEIAEHKYFFIGSGTGIAPFHSFVRSYPNLKYRILHGIRFAEEEYDRRDYGIPYISCVSRGNGGDFQGRVTDYLEKTEEIDSNMIFYLCGNSEMINDVYDILRNKGVSGTNIITEVFF